MVQTREERQLRATGKTRVVKSSTPSIEKISHGLRLSDGSSQKGVPSQKRGGGKKNQKSTLRGGGENINSHKL